MEEQNQPKTYGPFTDGQGMQLTVLVHYRGRWKIDKTLGKATMVIQIRNPNTNQTLDYAPTHSDICDAILDGILFTEQKNDQFLFQEGKKGPLRPFELPKKLAQLEAKLQSWKTITQQVEADRQGMLKALQIIAQEHPTVAQEPMKIERELAYTYVNGERVGMKDYYELKGIRYYQCTYCPEVHPVSDQRTWKGKPVCPSCAKQLQLYGAFKLEAPKKSEVPTSS